MPARDGGFDDSTGDGRGQYYRGGGLPQQQQLAEEHLKVLDRGDGYLHDVGVIAGDPVTFQDLRRRFRQDVDPSDLVGGEPYEGRDGKADLLGVDLDPIARYDACFFQPPDSLGDRGGGKTDASPKLGVANPGVLLKLLEDAPADLVQKPFRIQSIPLILP